MADEPRTELEELLRCDASHLAAEVIDCRAQLDVCKEALLQQTANVDSLRAQLEEVTKAFAEYGAHRSTCYAADPGTHWTEEMRRSQCDCGYVATAGRIARDAAVKPEQA